MSDDPNGPSKDVLKHLKGMLPSLAKGMGQHQIGGKGHLVARGTLKPRKLCPVCGKLYDKITTTAEISLSPVNCKDCAEMLKQGYTALVCGKKSCFVKCEALADKAGEVLVIGEEVFSQVQEKFDAQVRERKDDGNLDS